MSDHYSSSKHYKKGAVVDYFGDKYKAKRDVHGHSPISSLYWEKISDKDDDSGSIFGTATDVATGFGLGSLFGGDSGSGSGIDLGGFFGGGGDSGGGGASMDW